MATELIKNVEKQSYGIRTVAGFSEDRKNKIRAIKPNHIDVLVGNKRIANLSDFYYLDNGVAKSVDGLDVLLSKQLYGPVTDGDMSEVQSVEWRKNHKVSNKAEFTIAYDIHNIPTKFIQQSDSNITGEEKNITSVDNTTPQGVKKYAYVVMSDDTKRFVNVSEIYSLDSTRGQKTQYMSVKIMPEGNTYYTKDGQQIKTIYINKEYTFSDTLEAKNNNIVITDISVQDDNGEPKVTARTSSVSKYFTVRTYGNANGEDTVDVKTYEATDNGDYISVNISGHTAPMMVSVDSVSDEQGRPITNFNAMTGKKLTVKTSDGVHTTEPLTYEQANIMYSARLRYEKVDNTASEDTYLRLKNGKYVKEFDCAIAYKFVRNDQVEFDAYLVRIQSGTNVTEKIVSKAYYMTHTAEFNGAKVFKISRCRTDDAEIIQTTSKNNAVEYAKVLKKYNGDEYTGQVDQAIKKDSLIAYEIAYENGDYVVNDVFDETDEKAVDIENNRFRYVYSDHYSYVDTAKNSSEYASLNKRSLTYKDGKLDGGPEYSFKKGVYKSFAKWSKFLSVTVLAAVGMGVVLATVFPIWPIYVAGMAAWAGFIPLGHGIAKMIDKAKRSGKKFGVKQYKDELEMERKIAKEDAYTMAENLYEQALDMDNKNVTSDAIDDRYGLLLDKILELSDASVDNGVVLTNGEGKVNAGNIRQILKFKHEFNLETKAFEKEKKALEKERKDFEALEQQYLKAKSKVGNLVSYELEQNYLTAKANIEAKEKEFETRYKKHLEKGKNFTQAPEYKTADKEESALIENAENMRSFIYLKREYASKEIPEIEDSMSQEEKNKIIQSKRIKECLDDMEYNFTKGKFTYKGAEVIFDKNEGVLFNSANPYVLKSFDSIGYNPNLVIKSILAEVNEHKTYHSAESKLSNSVDIKSNHKSSNTKSNRSKEKRLQTVIGFGFDQNAITKSGNLKKTKENALHLLACMDRLSEINQILLTDESQYDEYEEEANNICWLYDNNKTLFDKVLENNEDMGDKVKSAKSIYNKYVKIANKINNSSHTA
ncbi:MAG: hypothetical protein E7351_03645 [Clostridiales bacterium]|nr:hypothetical protein [Clostridiales bacterium]